MLRSLLTQQDAQMEELSEMRRFMSEEMQNLKSDSWKYETYAELERVKQLFMTGQSLSSLSRAGSLDDGSLSAGSPPPSMTPSGSCSSEEDGPFLLKRTLYVNPSIFCTVAVHGVSVEEYVFRPFSQ